MNCGSGASLPKRVNAADPQTWLAVVVAALAESPARRIDKLLL
jgi:hypothetical protein